VVKTVLSGGAAEKAGFAAGDEWLGVETIKPQSGWRMQRLDDLLLYAGTAKKVIALVARDKRILRLDLTIPQATTTLRLAVKDSKRLDQWLFTSR
jgi:predicted metalloprotease with PDZ domain